MSRRLREEDKKVLQIKQEEEEEEDKLKLLKQRIAAPIVWARIGCGVRLQDLKEDHFNDVLMIMKDFYINNDVLYRNAEMSSDEESIKSLMERVMFTVKDTTSLVAIDETSKNVAGFLLMKVVHKVDYGQIFSRVIMNSGVAMKKVLAIETALNRGVDIFEKFSCDSFAQVFNLVVTSQYRKKGIGFRMLKSAFDIARSLKQTVIVAIFDNCVLQNKAKKLGMTILNEINYVDWRGKDGEMIFDDPGAGNYSCALMAGLVPEAPEPEPPPPPPPEEEKKKERVTRAEKRNEKAKAKKKH